jgi:large subunit ribosomal protein L4
MAAPKAPVLDSSGKKAKDATLATEIFGQEVRPHLLHEVVRAESLAARRGTQSTKSRGLVSGGRSKPWRQKGTGRARAGTTRAAQWTGGGHAFALQPRSYAVKVNRKARKAAFRAALSAHAGRGSLAVLDASGFGDVPSTKKGVELLGAWSSESPLLVVVQPDEGVVAKSFRNIDRALVVEPSELEVGALIWARSLLVTQSALERVQEMTKEAAE